MKAELKTVLKEVVKELLLEILLEQEVEKTVVVDENARNNSGQAVKKKGTSSKYKGVSFNKQRGKFQAHLKYKGDLEYLGTGTEEECALMYDKKCAELRGANAETNKSMGLI